MEMEWTWESKPSCVKGNQKHEGSFITIYSAFANIPLAKAGHVTKPRGGGGKGRGLQSNKAKSGRPVHQALSVSVYHTQYFLFAITLAEAERFYIKFPHYQFSFCFSIITSKAERPSEKSRGFGNQWDSLLYPGLATSGCMTLGKFLPQLSLLNVTVGLLTITEAGRCKCAYFNVWPVAQLKS